MKEIDSAFFYREAKPTKKKIEELIEPGESIIWKGRPKKSSYAISKSIKLMPVAILWGAIDFGIIFSLLGQGVFAEAWFFLVPFFALHLIPVWIWLGSFIKSSKEMRKTRYAITNRRIIEVKEDSYISQSIKFTTLRGVQLKRGFIDKLLFVGDVYISSTEGNLVLFDIYKSDFIYSKIQEVGESNRKTMKKFQGFECECEHCGSSYEKTEKRCPSCGAPNKNK